MPTAQSVIDDVRTDVLMDPDKIRWSDAELLRGLNAARREVATVRPSAFTTTVSHALVAGPRQTIPTTAVALVKAYRNTSGRAVRLVPEEQLNSLDPDWLLETPSAVVENYTYDPREPRAFYVYPPAKLPASLDLVVAVAPTDVALGDPLGMDDLYVNAVKHLIVYRAFTKDSEFAGPDARAVAAYQAYETVMGLRAQADAAQAPPAATEGSA